MPRIFTPDGLADEGLEVLRHAGGFEIDGRAGLGRIGREVAKRGRAFDMHVLGYDPLVSAERAAQDGIELVATVAEMVPRIDVLTVHVPMSPDTKGLIGADEFARMKPTAMVI